MMKGDKYSNNLDDFSEQIKQKLSGHTVHPDEDLWPTIQKKIKAPRRIIPLWTYYAVTAAAVVALLFSVANFFFMREHVLPVSEELKALQQEANQQLISPQTKPIVTSEETEQPVVDLSSSTAEAEQLTKTEDLKTEQIVDSPKKQQTTTEVVSDAKLISQKTIEQEVVVQTIDDDVSNIQGHHSPKNEAKKESDDKKIVKKHTSLPVVVARKDWTDIKPKKKKKKISISAMFGSGVTGSSATISPRSYAYRGESLVDISTKLANVLTPRDFKQKEYLPPMSAGLNTRLPVTDKLAVESGFIYTILQTRLSNSASEADFRASVDLHYLGLPANFVYSMIKERKWDVYISAGGTMEKGLQSDFKQYQNWDNKRISLEATPDIEGLQWSLNGSIGVDYFIHQNISLFFDPRLSYYFDNNQPYSIRKELPVIFSLNTGVRVVL